MDPRTELLLVFTLVELAIWTSGNSILLPCLFGTLPVALVLLYWRDHVSGLKNLFRPAAVGRIEYGHMYVAFYFCMTAILTIACLGNPKIFEQPYFLWNFAISLLCYLPNAFWQQALLNGYFLPKCEQAFYLRGADKMIAAIGVMFALAHLPNPVLVPASMVGGMLSVYFFRRTNNLYVLTAAHAVLAVSLMYFLPESWHHHMSVGPNFWHWQPK